MKAWTKQVCCNIYLVTEGDIERCKAAPRGCRINHIIVQQAGHVYEFRDLRRDGFRASTNQGTAAKHESL